MFALDGWQGIDNSSTIREQLSVRLDAKSTAAWLKRL
jgi:hypothetical protein